jgi:hypothetical protein
VSNWIKLLSVFSIVWIDINVFVEVETFSLSRTGEIYQEGGVSNGAKNRPGGYHEDSGDHSITTQDHILGFKCGRWED